MRSSYHDRQGIPHLYDTSTSTAEDSYSSGPRYLKQQHRVISPASTETPPRREQQRPQQQHAFPSRQEAPRRKRFPRIKKAASDTGVPTGGYEPYLQDYMYSRRSVKTEGSTLDFVDEYKYDQISLQQQENRQSMFRNTKESTRARHLQERRRDPPHHPAQQKVDYSHQGDLPPYYQDLRSRFMEKAVEQRNRSIQRYGQDQDESFESSIETPSMASVEDLKRQLWTKDEILNVKHSPPRQGRMAHSLSPIRRIHTNSTFDSDTTGGTANFKSKYYQAAMMAAREADENRPTTTKGRHAYEEVSPKNLRNLVERPRVESQGEESNFSSPSDEVGGRVRSSSTSRSSHHPTSLNMPALGSSQHTRGRQRVAEEWRARHASRSPSMEGIRRQHDAALELAQSISHEKHRERDLPRRRSPSPLIKERIQHYSEHPRGRSISRGYDTSNNQNSRAYSHEPHVLKASIEHSVGDGTSRQSLASTQVHRNTARQESNHASRYIFKEPIRRYTQIKEAPKERSQSLEKRPPTPPVKAPGRHDSYHSSEETTSRRDHADVAAYWHERARASPTFPVPHSPAILQSPSSANIQSMGSREGGYRSSDTGSSHPDHPHVAELVAKLSAVDRANPSEALAQIDSILRQEVMENSSEMKSENREFGSHSEAKYLSNLPKNDFADLENDDSSEFDDSTDVSSITNPSFQRGSKGKNESFEGQDGRPPNPFAVSTSSFRPPRPSALQAYSQSVLQQPDATTSRARESGAVHQKAPLPPPTIKIDKLQEEWEQTFIESSAFERFESTARIMVTPKHPDPRSPVRPMPSSRIDSRYTEPHSDTLEQSNGCEHNASIKQQRVNGNGKKGDPDGHGAREVSKNRDDVNDQYSYHQSRTLPSLSNSQRPHPWDTEIPARAQKVVAKETSMEDAAGVELNIPQRISKNMDFSSRSTLGSPAYFKTPEYPRKDSKGLLQDRTQTQISQDNTAMLTDSQVHHPTPRRATDVDMALIRAPQDLDQSFQSRRIEHGSSEQLSSPTRQQVHQEDHGDAWDVSIDKRGLFSFEPATPAMQPGSPQIAFRSSKRTDGANDVSGSSERSVQKSEQNAQGHSHQSSQQLESLKNPFGDHQPPVLSGNPSNDPYSSTSKYDTVQGYDRWPQNGPVDLEVSKATNGRQINESTQPSRATAGKDIIASDRETADLAWSSTSNAYMSKQVSERSRRRGLLRSFMKKDATKKKGSSSNAPRNQPTLPEFQDHHGTFPGRGRQELGSEAQSSRSRERSRSASGRFRSNNMAQKFGRVMRLYDDQD